jgi:single-stranded DNA-binding protein
MAKPFNSNNNVTLYGNIGRDPEQHSTPARSGVRKYYDAMIDEVVEQECDFPESHFLTYSVCCGGYNDIPVRWHNCVDWEGNAFRVRKGDRVKLQGQFQTRTYEDKNTGEFRESRQFVVVACEILKLKVREEAA